MDQKKMNAPIKQKPIWKRILIYPKLFKRYYQIQREDGFSFFISMGVAFGLSNILLKRYKTESR